MKKVQLNLDALSVDSFVVEEHAGAGGTVRGQSIDTVNDLGCPCTRGNSGCQYPSNSCPPTRTLGEFTCRCYYEASDPNVCC